MNKLLPLLLLLSFNAYASCPADELAFKNSLDVDKITSIRKAYDLNEDYYEILECYQRILQREAEAAIVKGSFKIAEVAANEMLRMDPRNSWAMLYMQISLLGQSKKVPAWYATDKMLNESSNDAFIRYLSMQLSANKPVVETKDDAAK